MSENADRRYSTVRWRTEEWAVRLNGSFLPLAESREQGHLTQGRFLLGRTYGCLVRESIGCHLVLSERIVRGR
jgi:hypothetical protein